MDFEKLKDGCTLKITVTEGERGPSSERQLHVTILDVNEQHVLEGLPDTEYLDSAVVEAGDSVSYITTFLVYPPL